MRKEKEISGSFAVINATVCDMCLVKMEKSLNSITDMYDRKKKYSL